ncbi:dihydroxyacetone phosphate acyltransferase-like isoform X2 [Phycodurus eques]|uniref:dihydroxyacetone phosphate acyltransferase-like isoform X2 n=1 Tax=Phycodurus eques TaxID=693459 RepID=UPI002ACD7B70|nr:dihydroxyacetone phosphate acyltransferase-like isoform X2 [Phycodurus eques]
MKQPKSKVKEELDSRTECGRSASIFHADIHCFVSTFASQKYSGCIFGRVVRHNNPRERFGTRADSALLRVADAPQEMANAHWKYMRVGLQEDDDEEEVMVDILEERRQSSDIGHALRTFRTHPYRGAAPCSASQLNAAVLASQDVCRVMVEVAMETQAPLEAVREQAVAILEEMSQNLQLGFVRLMGFMLSKVLKRLYSSIYVNMEAVHMLQQAVEDTPVILLPNHRSYTDFLVLSYIMFTYDIPLPVIASGLALAGMKFMGEMLRRCGAFYIRRDIASNRLYCAVLSEYVKSLVRTGFAPVEFYIEGFRSRSLKSLTPKLGMLHMVLDPYFKGEVSDITLVPISLSYDRLLEESLLARELLGIPKPKESTMGLLRVARVLREDYGCMHVNFGRPVSARQLCQGNIEPLISIEDPQRPSEEKQARVSRLAHLMVRIQERGSFTSLWSLMACLLLQWPPSVLTQTGLPWRQLAERTLWIKKLALNFGARLNWPGHVPDLEVMSLAVALHYPSVRLKAERVFLVVKEEDEVAGRQLISTGDDVARMAEPMLMMASYRNQSLHLFVRPALLAMALSLSRSDRRDEIFASFCFLQNVFRSEFIFIPGEAAKDFEEACYLLKKCGALDVIGPQEMSLSEGGVEVLSFLRAVLKPFIDSYRVMLRFLSDQDAYVITEKDFLPAVRSLATKLILSGDLHTYETLSSDVQKNVLSALRRMAALTKLKASEKEYRVDKDAVRRIERTLYAPD